MHYERLQNLIYTLKYVLPNNYSLFESYKVYDEHSILLNDSNIAILNEFKNISMRNLYKSEYLNSLTSSYLLYMDNPLFKEEGGKLYISHDLDFIIITFRFVSIWDFTSNSFKNPKYEHLLKHTNLESINILLDRANNYNFENLTEIFSVLNYQLKPLLPKKPASFD